MKKILVIILLIASLLLIGCQKQISADTITPTSIVTVTSIVTQKVEDTKRIDELEAELKEYKDNYYAYRFLVDDLNDLLKNVYYVYQKKSDGSSSWGTGFSIEYNGKYYLITAGHIVDGEYGIFKNLGFKANFSDNFIYPKLLTYKSDYINKNDYAILYSDKVSSGLMPGKETKNNFTLGYGDINLIKQDNYNIEGESGSPYININGEVTGILTSDYFYRTEINTVLGAIDNLK